MRPMQLHDPGLALATLESPSGRRHLLRRQAGEPPPRPPPHARAQAPSARDALTECVCSACAQAGWPTRARAVRSAVQGVSFTRVKACGPSGLRGCPNVIRARAHARSSSCGRRVDRPTQRRAARTRT
eukprot:5013566-Prymnesium_polylepis.1